MRIRLLVVFILFLGSKQVFSQYTDFKYKRKNHTTDAGYLQASKQTRYISGGIGISVNNYLGDLTPKDNFVLNVLKVTRPGISAFVSYRFANRFNVKSDLFYARIIGDDFNTDPYKSSGSIRKYTRNLSFRNDLFGLSLHATMDIFNDPFEYYKRRDINFYILGGITLYYSNPKAKLHENQENLSKKRWVALRPLGTEGQNHPDYGGKYSSIQFAIPFGFGIRYRINSKFDLIAEGTISYILSDYIDDIGSSYVDLGALDSDLSRAMSDRSGEEKAVMKNEERDRNVINAYTNYIDYTSPYDGNTYRVLEGFGHDKATRGGPKNDLVNSLTFKISYIFTN